MWLMANMIIINKLKGCFMRFFIMFFLLVTIVNATDSVSFFKKSSENELLCHVGQYSFKMVSQKNATVEVIHGHRFFKLNDENMYFLNNACRPLKDKKEGIIF